MKQLIVFVLRLLLQLVLFGITGRWYELGRPAAPLPRAPRPTRTGPRRERTFRPETKATRARAPRTRAREGTFDADFAADLAADFGLEGRHREPAAPVLEGGLPRVAAGRRRARAVARAPATSLRAALSDRRVLRDALILEAALGARGRGR